MALQKLITKDIETKITTNSIINWVDYVFEEDLKDPEFIGKEGLSIEPENSRNLEVESQDSLIEVILGTKSQKNDLHM